MVDFDKYLDDMRLYPLVDIMFEDYNNHRWVVELTTGGEVLLQYMPFGKVKVSVLAGDGSVLGSWLSEGDWLNDLTKAEEMAE